MAYKSVDISDKLMKQELETLRKIQWKVLETVHNQYDFGLVYLDCVKFKDRVLQHAKGLEKFLEDYLKSDFTAKFKNIRSEIVSVEGKLDMEVHSIDDVIMLLDYIDSLGKQGNKIADIDQMIKDLKLRMDYLEEVNIIFADNHYFEFLEMRNWPRTFQAYIKERKTELLAKKEDLYNQMNEEINEVFDKIKKFKQIISSVMV